jgi:ribosomal protein S21
MKRRKNYSHNRQHPIRTCLTVTADECRGDADRMVRKFIKKAKKEKIVEEYRQRSHFISGSEKRAEKKRQKQRIIKKHNLRMEELFSYSSARNKSR